MGSCLRNRNPPFPPTPLPGRNTGLRVRDGARPHRDNPPRLERAMVRPPQVIFPSWLDAPSVSL
jgi:hypothetical protein